ncbi:dihydroxyacetone kinase subunit DhaK [Alkalihalobacillus macyae]|uniref:dihydroxyacetone kinase subunit DhaK n=1 Tax=Guptibacillus hwajinpoensis TaxID=208199 RepID=UPI00273BC34F|nr:dihydroxyacetone kinase subunit DhaK [Alkalihalobacillus macyae]MDP4549357.1 dihydroxyacetone kinase subunit DhaK [Alkalihalobacillus macyae]
MKKLINHPEEVVTQMLDGMVKAHPETYKRLEGTTVLVRRNKSSSKVGIVSGGGSGHEPAHAGYVGEGMLDAAVSGEVFTSPTPDQVLEAIKAVDQGAGVLLVTKNYTGDVMNFEMAAEMAEDEGIQVEQVIVNDDVAVEDSTHTTGRRGVGGTIFVHKIAGAAAQEGKSLEEVKTISEEVIRNARSMGVAVKPAQVPGSGNPGFDIGENEMELGIGIHGEPGMETIEMTSADHVAERLIEEVLPELEVKDGDDVAVLVNGMGATPMMELYILNNRIHDLLNDKGINTELTLVGNYMTALEMSGASLTVLKVTSELKNMLNKPCHTIAWTKSE